MRLVADSYLEFHFQATAYTTNVYLKAAARSERFTRFTRTDIEAGKGPALDLVLVKKASARRKSTGGAKVKTANPAQAHSQSQSQSQLPFKAAPLPRANGGGRKRKRGPAFSEDEEEGGGGGEGPSIDLSRFEGADNDGSEDEGAAPGRGGDGYESLDGFIVTDDDDDEVEEIEDSDDDYGWEKNQRGARVDPPASERGKGKAVPKARAKGPPAKRPRNVRVEARQRAGRGASSSSRTLDGDDVIDISSD